MLSLHKFGNAVPRRGRAACTWTVSSIDRPQFFRTRDRKAHSVTKYALDDRPLKTRGTHGVHARADGSVTIRKPEWAEESWVTVHDRARELQTARPDALISGLTAAELMGWPLGEDLRGGPLHVVTSDGGGRVRRQGVVGHRSKFIEPITMHGIRMNAARFVLLELAPVLSEWQLVLVADALMGNWHGPPIVGRKQLSAFVTDVRGYSGRSRLIAAVARAREDVDSPQETELRLTIIEAGLPEPVIHHTVVIPGAGRVTPDLAYPEAKIAIEYEGEQHRLDPDQHEYDIRRYDAMRRAGWEVIRVTKRTPRRKYLAQIRAALAERTS
jgi:very-short-patch-repair endonuclease